MRRAARPKSRWHRFAGRRCWCAPPWLDGQKVTVTLKGGVYRSSETLVLKQEDSGTAEAPVLWQASPGQEVVISGGTLLNLRWKPFRNGIFKADVPADFVSDQLFVNGVLQHMARYPNYDQNQRIMNGYAADCISPERVARWANPNGGYIHAMHAHLWGDYHYRITGKKADGTLRYEGGWQNNRQMGMHPEYRYVENIFEELDTPRRMVSRRRFPHALLLPSARDRLGQRGGGIGAAAASNRVPRQRREPGRSHHSPGDHLHAHRADFHGQSRTAVAQRLDHLSRWGFAFRRR